jgi:hypothetical protein
VHLLVDWMCSRYQVDKAARVKEMFAVGEDRVTLSRPQQHSKFKVLRYYQCAKREFQMEWGEQTASARQSTRSAMASLANSACQTKSRGFKRIESRFKDQNRLQLSRVEKKTPQVCRGHFHYCKTLDLNWRPPDSSLLVPTQAPRAGTPYRRARGDMLASPVGLGGAGKGPY